METEWQLYRTRFLVKAKQLTRRTTFVDALGREHRGNKGDYLVESSDGGRRIAPREIFEDVYVTMDSALSDESRTTALSPLMIGITAGRDRRTLVENRSPSQASRSLIA
jgi:hypothetical protein